MFGSTDEKMPVPVRSEYADDEDFRELIEAFVETFPDKRRSMADLFQGGQIDELGRAAHQLKGAAGGYGFPEVTTAASLLQEACDNRDAARVEQSLADVLDLLARAQI
jgi:histidine phosphotransfer protein HptB